MDTATVAPVGGAPEAAPVSTPANDAPLSVREAAHSLAKRRDEAEKQDSTNRAPDGKFARAEKKDSAPAENANAPDESQTSVEVDPVAIDPVGDAQPSIEAPRSWTKEEKEAFAALPPEHQQRIADRERARELEIRRGQNEVSDAKKAAEAERQAAEGQRRQYEQAIENNLLVVASQMQAEFQDIKSWDDVRKLAEEDPFRFARFQAQKAAIDGLKSEVDRSRIVRAEENATKFKEWATEQDAEFKKQAPEFADPEKGAAAREQALGYLKEIRGVPQERIEALWTGRETVSIRDATVQMIIRDAAKWHDAQKKAKAAVAQQPPPVQRPGSAPSRGDAATANIQALQQKLDRATSQQDQIRAAAALRAAKRAAAR